MLLHSTTVDTQKTIFLSILINKQNNADAIQHATNKLACKVSSMTDKIEYTITLNNKCACNIEFDVQQI